ncbi:hypothetical protein C0585_05415 [Candidatus Woesearchaeota archaeon]|nr:MAG: hypothetical protein C0585_05415 [Candidatus Woesearchaeota archaeon]
MNYKSVIFVDVDKPKDLLEIFEPEMKNSINDRALYNLTALENSVKFDIEAKDSVSLRAVLNSITKLLTVYEKLKH